MRTSVLFSLVLLAASGNASWFGSDDKPEYDNWDTQQLHHWLEANSIRVPDNYGQKDLRKLVAANWELHKPWTQAYYDSAQQYFEGVHSDAFDAWDESQLRHWLVQQGVVEPKGPREALIASAQNRYKQYTSAASALSSQASAAASTAVYGDAAYQASKAASSVASAASSKGAVFTNTAASAATEASKAAASAYATAAAFASKKMDDTKDYVYSTWDDNQLRTYLENKGVIKTKQQATRDELLAKMGSIYNTATDPVYNAWSDSYMKQWLVAHGIIKSDYEAKRDYYTNQLKTYYYGPQEKVWSSWSDSDTKAWLVKNGYVKSDAQVTREKMQNLVAKNYYNAKDTTWSAWDDSSMRTWLIDNGYLRSDAKVKRDELVKLMNEKYNDLSARTADYLTWPDARLRAYLRSQGIDDSKFVPGDRPSLLQEVRIRYYQVGNRLETLMGSIRDTINAGVGTAEAKLAQILDMIKGNTDHAADYAAQGTDAAKGYASKATDSAKDAAAQAGTYADQKAKQAGKTAADKAATAAAGAETKARTAKKQAEEARDEL